jgi:hypothetical protein
MDNMYRPTGGADPQDSRSTEQFWAPPPGPSGPAPQRPGAQQPPSLQQHYARDRRHAMRWSTGLTLALVLAAGGVLAGVALAGHGAPASSVSQAGDAAAASQPGAQAAALNTALNAADAPGTLTLTSVGATAAGGRGTAASAAGSGTATGMTGSGTAATAPHPCRKARAALRAAVAAGRPRVAQATRLALARCHGIRRRLFRVFLLRGIDGQYTFRTKQGTIRTLAFERGVIESVSGSVIVVRAVDGTTWSWNLVSNTVVREHGTKTSTSALASGEPVWLGGPVVSGAKDARLVVIRPPSPPTTGAPSTATPAPSASGS